MGSAAFEFAPHLTAIPYLTIPTGPLPASVTPISNGTTVVSNGYQQK